MLVAEQQAAKTQSVPREPRAGMEQLVESKAASVLLGVWWGCAGTGDSARGAQWQAGYQGEDKTPLPGVSAVPAGGESLGKYLLCLLGLSHPT